MQKSLKKTWKNSDLESLPWTPTYITDEIPSDDSWDTFATKNKLWLEEQYRKWGIPKESGLHYMSIRPDLNENLKSILTAYQNKNFNYNFLKLTPGCQLTWHFDTFSTFVKYNNIKENDIDRVNRTVVMMTDWDHGQVLEIDGKVFFDWKSGDTFTWKGYTWHGLCNFGPSDIIVAQITFYE
jgi:hypothetical protein